MGQGTEKRCCALQLGTPRLWSSTDVDAGDLYLHEHVCMCVRMFAPNFLGVFSDLLNK